MKVAFVISSLDAGGGAERNTCYLADELVQRGHDLTIFVLSASNVAGYTLDPRVAIETVPQGRVFSRGGPAVLARVLYLRRRLASFDVCVGIMVTSNVLTALACWGLRTRSIAAERNSPEYFPHSRLWRFLRARTYGIHGAVVTQTERAAEWLRAHTNSQRVVAIPNPQISTQSRLPSKSLEDIVLPEDILILAVGRLDPQKGFDRLVSILARVFAGRPELKAVILGEGEERERIEELVKRAELTGRVVLPGHAGNVADWYRRADIFVMTSRFEGYPNALIEARAEGAPAIAFDCPEGPAEIIAGGLDGFVVPNGDEAGFADRLIQLADDAELRQTFRRNARQRASLVSNKDILDAWDEVLGADPQVIQAPADLRSQSRARREWRG